MTDQDSKKPSRQDLEQLQKSSEEIIRMHEEISSHLHSLATALQHIDDEGLREELEAMYRQIKDAYEQETSLTMAEEVKDQVDSILSQRERH